MQEQAHKNHRKDRKDGVYPKSINRLALILSTGIISAVFLAGLAWKGRYGKTDLNNILLTTDAVEGHQWVGENISFHQIEGNQFDVVFALNNDGSSEELALENIDLSLFIPTVPDSARNNEALTKWFLIEREFNRQRVIFEAGSQHINLPEGFAGYDSEDLSISLTNNCLGAGYWELAVSVQHEDGSSEKIYQGYFTFPRGAYAGLVAQLNPTHYWKEVRRLEAWPGFGFLSGMTFDVSALRQVAQEEEVAITDFESNSILAVNEQVSKADLVVYQDTPAKDIETWADLRQADVKFQSFVAPGVYDPNQLWGTDYAQLATVESSTARQIVSPLASQELLEIEIEFANVDGEQRKFIVSGLDLAQIPQLDSSNYAEGIYMPLGFGTPFTQNYSDLVQNPPSESPYFSVWLDSENRVINYRQDIGVNGVVLHRDIHDETLLHVYIMAYERITLVGHYMIDLSDHLDVQLTRT